MECSTEAGVVFDVNSLYAHFQTLKDSRKPKGLRYELGVILVMITLAKICGQDTPSGIADWVKHRAEQFIEALKLKRKSMPHHSTYRRILAEVIAIEELEQMASRYLTEKKFFGRQVLLSIDGKVLRGTLNEQQEGVYLLAAYLPSKGIVLMEVKLKGKGTEIPGAAKLLKMVDLREKVVMGDAIHTQREASIQIVEAGGDYIWIAKGNQSEMEENIRLWFEPEPDPMPGMGRLPKDFEVAKEVCKGHGRLEERKITVSSQLKDYLQWPYLEQVFMLDRRYTSTKTGETNQQTRYGFTSLPRNKITPDKLLEMARSYWGIENGLHYRRDVTLNEDRTRMTKGNLAPAMACINNLVIGLLIGKLKYRYLPDARRFFDAHPAKAFDLILLL
jgi:predicted transposase YbfD/YdcC